MSEAQQDDPYFEADAQHYVLRLFVTGTTPRSTRAIENLRQICEEYLAGRYTLEVVDIYQSPEAARDHQVIAAPTLVKLLPEPVRRELREWLSGAMIFGTYGAAHDRRSGRPRARASGPEHRTGSFGRDG